MKSRWKALKDRDKQEPIHTFKESFLCPDPASTAFLQRLQMSPDSLPQILEVPEITNKAEPSKQSVNNYFYCLPLWLFGQDPSGQPNPSFLPPSLVPGHQTVPMGCPMPAVQQLDLRSFCAFPRRCSQDQATQTDELVLSPNGACDDRSMTRDSDVGKATVSSQSESDPKDAKKSFGLLEAVTRDPTDSSTCSAEDSAKQQSEMSPSLSTLYSLVQGLFLEGRLSKGLYCSLPLFERRVLYYLVKRKFATKFKEGFEADEVACEWQHVLALSEKHSIRRPEECYKFVLTRVLKHLRKRLESERGEHVSEAGFYQLYFGEVAERLGAPVTDFYFPLSGTKKGKAHFNLSYFSKIFQSGSFVGEVGRYCQAQMFEDFRADFAKKVQSMVRRWNKLIQEQQEFTQYAQQSILKYIIYNRRCKLPWTRNEVEQAITRIRNLMVSCPPQQVREEELDESRIKET